MKKFPVILAVVLALLGTGSWGVDDAYAKETKEQKRARKLAEQRYAHEALQRGEILPMARILVIAGEFVPGELLKVELDHKKLLYKVTILTPSGQIRKLELDARNGAFVKMDTK